MGVIQVGEAPDSPTGSFTNGQFKFQRKFKVQCSSLFDGPLEVMATTLLPKWGDFYIFGNEALIYAYAKNFTPKRLADNSVFWECTVDYETPDPFTQREGSPRDVQQQFGNPLLELPEVEMSYENFQQPVYQAYDTNNNLTQVKASNGEIFIPPPQQNRFFINLTITRNEFIDAPHPALGITYMLNCNSDIFWGFQAGCVQCKGITATRQTKNLSDGTPFSYLKVKYSFAIRDTWNLKILDQGTWYNATVGGQSVKKKFLTDDGHPRSGALDGTGKALADGATPVFIDLQIYPRTPFGPLGLPQNFLLIS